MVKSDVPAVLRCKCCVIGDATIGKTALVDVYTKGNSKFPKNYNMVRHDTAAHPALLRSNWRAHPCPPSPPTPRSVVCYTLPPPTPGTCTRAHRRLSTPRPVAWYTHSPWRSIGADGQREFLRASCRRA